MDNTAEVLRQQNELIKQQTKQTQKTQIWLMFFFLGWSYGYFGQIGKQILFYLTAGGLGIWTLFVLFTLNKKIREYQNQSV